MYCVLTYDTPHRKTQDLLFYLKSLGYSEVLVVASPYKYEKRFTPLIEHRPSNPIPILPKDFCKTLGFQYQYLNTENLASFFKGQPPKLILVGGAGLLPEEIVKSWTVVNAHPGYLPLVRGLDALKWAIYYNYPIGVTSHVLSEKTDAGLLIRRELIPISSWDTFHSIAYRQYETEIRMLGDAIQDVQTINIFETLSDDVYAAFNRMPNEIEKTLYEKTKIYLKQMSSKVDV